jgi:hypothetical protein
MTCKYVTNAYQRVRGCTCYGEITVEGEGVALVGQHQHFLKHDF